MSEIKHVFLDLDDTLFDFHRSEGAALSKTLCSLGVEPTENILALYSKINRAHWEMLERKEATRAEILTGRFRALYKEIGKENLSPDKTQAIYEKNLSREFCYIDGAKELLDGLFGKYRLYIASNGTAAVQDGRISLSGIGKYFDGIFISQKIGYDKPDRKFFEACFSAIPNFSKKEAIIVGDSLTSDIFGGKNAGILTCHFNPHEKKVSGAAIPDFEISALADLPGLLEKI